MGVALDYFYGRGLRTCEMLHLNHWFLSVPLISINTAHALRVFGGKTY